MYKSRIFLMLRRPMSWCYLWSWILRLVSLGDHKIYKMPASSSFSVRKGLAQMLLHALERGPTEKNDDNKNGQPWEIYRWAQRSRNMVHGIVILVQHICGFDYEVTISSHMRQGYCGHGSEYLQMFLMVKISELLGLRIFCKTFRKFQTFTT